MSLLKLYYNSFQRKTILFTFLVDLLLWSIIVILFTWFGSLVQQQAVPLNIASSAEQIQNLLATAPEQAQEFLQNLKSFLFLFVGGSIVILVLFLFSYSLTQSWIWNYLLGKAWNPKNYWRWNALNVALLIPFLLYLLPVFIIKSIFNYLLSGVGNQLVTITVDKIITFVFLLIFIVFLFLVYHSFAQKYKVFESIGQAFHLIKLHWSKLWRMFILVVLTGILLNLLLSLLQRFFLSTSLFISTPKLFTLLSTIVFLLYLAWLRVYVVQVVSAQG